MSKQSKQLKLVVKGGVIHAIYDDALTALYPKARSVDIKRASHVEPDRGGWGWVADMTPVGGPVLQDFETRQEALNAEVRWLKRNVIV